MSDGKEKHSPGDQSSHDKKWSSDYDSDDDASDLEIKELREQIEKRKLANKEAKRLAAAAAAEDELGEKASVTEAIFTLNIPRGEGKKNLVCAFSLTNEPSHDFADAFVHAQDHGMNITVQGFKRGYVCEAYDKRDNKFGEATIVDLQRQQAKVTWKGYSPKSDQWVDLASVKYVKRNATVRIKGDPGTHVPLGTLSWGVRHDKDLPETSDATKTAHETVKLHLARVQQELEEVKLERDNLTKKMQAAFKALKGTSERNLGRKRKREKKELTPSSSGNDSRSTVGVRANVGQSYVRRKQKSSVVEQNADVDRKVEIHERRSGRTRVQTEHFTPTLECKKKVAGNDEVGDEGGDYEKDSD